MSADPETLLDCDEGRRRGCQTFCCRLVVRLTDAEAERWGAPTMPKDDDGLCVHLDRGSHRCTIWSERPQICREYDCNEDPNLQVVLRDGFQSLVQLATARPVLPLEAWVSVPRARRQKLAQAPENKGSEP